MTSENKQRFANRQSNSNGVGPFRTGDELPAIPSIGPGDTFILDLRRLQKGKFVSLSPKGYDSMSVTNSSNTVTIVVGLNESGSIEVPPNAVEGREQSGMYHMVISNTHATDSVSGSDVTLEIEKEAFGADEQARSRRNESPVRSVIRNITGI